MKEELAFFLPLYIHPQHGEEIKETIEETMRVKKFLYFLTCLRRLLAWIIFASFLYNYGFLFTIINLGCGSDSAWM